MRRLRDGASIADVAEERNVDMQDVIDAMFAAAETRSDELKANLPERITDIVNEPLPFAGIRFRHDGLKLDQADRTDLRT